MNQIVESIKAELIERCNNYKLKYGFDYWNDHIKYVVKNAVQLANKYNADVMAHFDAIPSLFHLAFGGDEKNMTLEDGTEFVRKKLERDFNKLSDKTREDLRERYENIVKILFVEK